MNNTVIGFEDPKTLLIATSDQTEFAALNGFFDMWRLAGGGRNLHIGLIDKENKDE